MPGNFLSGGRHCDISVAGLETLKAGSWGNRRAYLFPISENAAVHRLIHTVLKTTISYTSLSLVVSGRKVNWLEA